MSSSLGDIKRTEVTLHVLLSKHELQGTAPPWETGFGFFVFQFFEVRIHYQVDQVVDEDDLELLDSLTSTSTFHVLGTLGTCVRVCVCVYHFRAQL